jgi:hypothetical protein
MHYPVLLLLHKDLVTFCQFCTGMTILLSSLTVVQLADTNLIILYQSGTSLETHYHILSSLTVWIPLTDYGF